MNIEKLPLKFTILAGVIALAFYSIWPPESALKPGIDLAGGHSLGQPGVYCWLSSAGSLPLGLSLKHDRCVGCPCPSSGEVLQCRGPPRTRSSTG